MNAEKISQIAASVLYLDENSKIDISKSLFKEYGMSSLDFVDFAYELKAAANKNFDPDALWPVNIMMNNLELYSGGDWTDLGRADLAKIFNGHAQVPDSVTPDELYALFSVAYVEHRLRDL